MSWFNFFWMEFWDLLVVRLASFWSDNQTSLVILVVIWREPASGSSSWAVSDKQGGCEWNYLLWPRSCCRHLRWWQLELACKCPLLTTYHVLLCCWHRFSVVCYLGCVHQKYSIPYEVTRYRAKQMGKHVGVTPASIYQRELNASEATLY